MLRATLLLTLMGTAALGGWLLRGWLVSAGPADTNAAGVCRVVRGRMDHTVKARGIVKPAPNGLIRLGFPFPKDLARRIGLLAVVEGDLVEPGALLAELDQSDLEATLAQLRAELQVSERRLEALKVLEPVEVRLAETAVAERKAQLEQARRINARLNTLVRGTAASAEQGEAATFDQAVAQARVDQADTSLRQTRARFQTDAAVLEAQIEQGQAAIQATEVQIRWCRLYSPLSTPAQVFAVHQRQGELTSGLPAAPVLTLLDLDQLQVHLFVDEADFGHVRAEQPVSLRLEAHPEEVIKGRIVRVLPQPILQDNVVYYLGVVEVAPEQRSFLRAEMTALGHVQIGGGDSVLWLPLGAVKSRPEGWYVLKSGPSGPVETPVRIGWKTQGRVEIRDGLAEGDEVLLQ